MTRTYRHPTGVALRYPEDWTLHARFGSAVLVPPGAAEQEAYLLLFALVEGAASATDSQVVEIVSAQVLATMPTLGAAGPLSTRTVDGVERVRLRFRGGAPGVDAAAVVLDYAVIGDMMFGLMGMGEEAAIEARAAEVQRIADSFAFGEPGRDPQLVGTWSRSESMSDPISGASLATRVLLRLDASGGFERRSRAVGMGMDTGDGQEAGVWAAGEGALVLLARTGVAQFEYGWHEGSLVLCDADGHRALWARA